ncbi:MAG: MerC domain-containing protein [Saprospiraceae bacterium]|nr:MerC domain-containing protein [Saprospiraceae bacterium]
MPRFTSWNLDFLGFFASALCAIHCLALPFILTLGMLGGLEWMAHGLIEFVFIVLSMLIASWSLGRSIPRHGSWRPVYVAVFGFGFLALSRIIPGHAEHLLTAIGGIIIAYSHYVNWRLLNHHCALPAHMEKREASPTAIRA